jgi:hypothetical protein
MATRGRKGKPGKVYTFRVEDLSRDGAVAQNVQALEA